MVKRKARKLQVTRILLLVVTIFWVFAERSAAEDLELRARSHVTSLAPSRVKEMLTDALGRLGTPYRWGGDDFESDKGVDCVGFVYALFHKAGLEFPLARFSSLNMTSVPRGAAIQKLWWNEYFPDFEKDMVQCAPPVADGDVVVYHQLKDKKIEDRTGHVVIALDAKVGLAISAAHGGVKLHKLGDFSRFDHRERTGCWRPASATKEPFVRPNLKWSVELSDGDGTKSSPYHLRNPVSFVFAVKGEVPEGEKLVALGRVNSFIGAVEPKLEKLASKAGLTRYRVTHDFKAVDLPVDPGETIRTPLRKIVLRYIDKSSMVLGEMSFYIQLHPYW